MARTNQPALPAASPDNSAGGDDSANALPPPNNAPVAPLTGTVRVTAIAAFYTASNYLVEVGKSVDLPAAEAEDQRELGKVRFGDRLDPEAPADSFASA